MGIFHAISGTPSSGSSTILWYRRARPAIILLSLLCEKCDVGFLLMFPMETPTMRRVVIVSKSFFYCLCYILTREAHDLIEQVSNLIMWHDIILIVLPYFYYEMIRQTRRLRVWIRPKSFQFFSCRPPDIKYTVCTRVPNVLFSGYFFFHSSRGTRDYFPSILDQCTRVECVWSQVDYSVSTCYR